MGKDGLESSEERSHLEWAGEVLLPQSRPVVLCALANDEAERGETDEKDGERGEGD